MPIVFAVASIVPATIAAGTAAMPGTVSRLVLALDIGEAKQPGSIVVREDFGVAAPVDHRIKRGVGFILAQLVLQLLHEALARGALAGTGVQYLQNAGCQRNMLGQMNGKQLLAGLRIGIGKT